MKEINELSGNIKIRMPKSLHDILHKQSEIEGISINQLCLMYLSLGVSQGTRNLGAFAFDRRLEQISMINDEVKMFEKLKVLNSDVEMLKPLLLKELKGAMTDKKRLLSDYIETLRYIYPINHGTLYGEKMPMLKVPSAKIVVTSRDDIDSIYRDLNNRIKKQCCDAVLSVGDYDLFKTHDRNIIDELYFNTMTIHVRCSFDELKENIKSIKKVIETDSGITIKIKPCYMHVATSKLMFE